MFGPQLRKLEHLSFDTRFECNLGGLRLDQGVQDSLPLVVDERYSRDVLLIVCCCVRLD